MTWLWYLWIHFAHDALESVLAGIIYFLDLYFALIFQILSNQALILFLQLEAF
jgi:hypothetical protein